MKMKLKISVIKYKGVAPTDKQDFVFDEEGGNLGRADYCTWCLPDKDNYISKIQLSLFFQNEKFHLIDMSLNGCFINQSNIPVEKGNRYELKDNDTIRMGKYELQVSYIDLFDENNDAKIDWLTSFPSNYTLGVKASSDDIIDYIDKEKTKDESVAVDIDSSLNLDTKINKLLPEENIPTLINKKINIDEEDIEENIPVESSGGHTLIFKRREVSDDSEMKIIKVGKTDSASAVVENKPIKEIPAQLSEKETLVFEKIFRAAGINTEKLLIKPTVETPIIIGEALNEMLQGIMALLESRAKIKEGLRVEDKTLIQVANNNPLKLLPSAEHAITELILLEGSDEQRDDIYLSLIEAIRESFDDLKAHQLALTMSIQEALASTIQEYFSPENLQEKLEKSTSVRVKFPWQRKANLWELFETAYKGIEEEASEQFQLVLERKIANAYELNIREIKQQ